jgi:hypothetical protein
MQQKGWQGLLAATLGADRHGEVAPLGAAGADFSRLVAVLCNPALQAGRLSARRRGAT